MTDSKPGDLVRLVSGGPVMVVARTDDPVPDPRRSGMLVRMTSRVRR